MKIVAEIGSNWVSFDDIKNSIIKAKECGADAVKFQMFTAKELYGSEAYGEHMHQHYIHKTDLPKMLEICNEVNIEFMCTAFSSQGYEIVNEFVSTHKIASSELTDTGILETVNSFRKPVYLSTGGSSLDEIRLALIKLRDCKVTIMFCVADYPAKIVDFRNFMIMKEFFGNGYDYGFSDHSLDVLHIPTLGHLYECDYVLEKHVNFTSHKHTPDAGHSLNEKEFSLMVRNLKGEDLSPKETELATNQDMKQNHRRRFIAIGPIDKGDKFVIGDNIGIFRPRWQRLDGTELSTFRPWDLDNKSASRDMKFGETLCMEDLS